MYCCVKALILAGSHVQLCALAVTLALVLFLLMQLSGIITPIRNLFLSPRIFLCACCTTPLLWQAYKNCGFLANRISNKWQRFFDFSRVARPRRPPNVGITADPRNQERGHVLLEPCIVDHLFCWRPLY